MENYVAKYVEKYNMFDAADGLGWLVRLSVHESMILFATVIGECGCCIRALPR